MKFMFRCLTALGSSILISVISSGNAPVKATFQSEELSKKSQSVSGVSESEFSLDHSRKLQIIATSPELNNLLYNLTYKVTGIARYYKTSGYDWVAAYDLAWWQFSKISDNWTIVGGFWSPTAGYYYTSALKGGGTSSLREYGVSVPPMPTIEIKNHKTLPLNGQDFSVIKEVKFPYTQLF